MTDETKPTDSRPAPSTSANEIDPAEASPEERRALYREAFQIANLGGRTFRQDRLDKVLDIGRKPGA